MNKLIYYLWIMAGSVIMAMSCNDNSSTIQPKPDLLLTKIEQNGVTLLEFAYDTEATLVRTNFYYSGEIFSYTLYDYNEDGVQESRHYLADDDAVNGKTVFTLDNFGRIKKVENYDKQSNFKEVASLATFNYDPSDRLVKKQLSTAGEPVHSVEEFTYGAAHHPLKEQTTFYPNQPNEYVFGLTEYTLGDRTLYSHWEPYIVLLIVSGFDQVIWEMFNTSVHHKGWYEDGDVAGESQTDASEREFNPSGYLTRQILTQQSPFNPGITNVREMTYEYTEINE
jgi:hypothetical protein